MTLNTSLDQDTTTSKFYMLRCLIAMAHADGIVCDEERAYIGALTERISLSEEQKKAIEDDLDNEKKLSELLPYINDPYYKGQLVYFARIMAHKDGILHPNEEELLKKFHSYALEGADIEQIKTSVESAVQAEMLMHDIEIQDKRAKRGEQNVSWIQLFDEFMNKSNSGGVKD